MNQEDAVKPTQTHTHNLTAHIHKGKLTNVYIGKLEEIPGIIVYSKDRNEVKQKLYEAIDAYFDAFDDQHDIIFEENSEESVEKILVQV